MVVVSQPQCAVQDIGRAATVVLWFRGTDLVVVWIAECRPPTLEPVTWVYLAGVPVTAAGGVVSEEREQMFVGRMCCPSAAEADGRLVQPLRQVQHQRLSRNHLAVTCRWPG